MQDKHSNNLQIHKYDEMSFHCWKQAAGRPGFRTGIIYRFPGAFRPGAPLHWEEAKGATGMEEIEKGGGGSPDGLSRGVRGIIGKCSFARHFDLIFQHLANGHLLSTSTNTPLIVFINSKI